MPNIKSSIKRVKVNEKKSAQNRMVKSSVKTAIKKFDTELASNPSTAAQHLSETTSKIDKADAKGVLHKNAKKKKKAQLAKKVVSAGA